jgi:glycosidase
MSAKFRLIFLFALTAFSTVALAAQNSSPMVEKVEPPNWWTRHTINPVRLLVRGTGFQNAQVISQNKQLQISNVRANERGDYLFFDVTIAPQTQIGKYEFEILTDKGEATIPFEISAPLDATKNFQGITNDDVIYLIMTDRFSDGDESNNANVDRKNPRAWHGGDFRGVINHLDYLKDLGVTAIWLTPWYKNSDEVITCDKPWCPMTSYHGYGAIDYYAVDNHFGSFNDLRELIERAHAAGIKIVQDQVANHVSFRHPWMQHPPLDDWFSPFEQNSFNNSALLSPNASEAERNNLIHGWFDFSLPDLNQDEPEVARYEIQNALWWIAMTGVDGIREDTIQYMPRPFIRDWSRAIKKQYPRFWMVGEVFEEDSAQTAFFQGGRMGWDKVDTNLPSVFDFKLWRTSLEVFTNKKPTRALRDVLKYDALYPNVDNLVTISGNHDTSRFMSLEGATTKGALLHLAFLFSARGIPQLYYGEELGMRGGQDPDNRRDFPGGFPGDSHSAFTQAGRTLEEQNFFEQTQKWIKLRRANKSLKTGKTIDLYYDDDVYVFERKETDSGSFNSVIIAFNNGEKDKQVVFPYRFLEATPKNFERKSHLNETKTDSPDVKRVHLKLPSKSVNIYSIYELAKTTNP